MTEPPLVDGGEPLTVIMCILIAFWLAKVLDP